MRPYTVGWFTPEGDPQVYLNDRCVRCGAYRNEYIGCEQDHKLRHEPTAIVLEAP
jgi:hypothetical protein